MKSHTAAALLFPLVVAAAPVRAARLPLWEAGAGIAALNLPDYRGADRRANRLLPLPYVIYRGKFLKADRNGVRATLFAGGRVQLNLSVNATLPVSSSDNPLRDGMPDLRPALEIGPTADFRLWEARDGRARLRLRLPLRTVLTVESSPRDIGLLFSPQLEYSRAGPFGLSGWNVGIAGGPLFSSRRYNRYFYSVDAAEARPGRPAYRAPGGYAGTQWTATLSHRFRRYWVGAFLRYDNLAGAVFGDSPLVRRRSALGAGVGVAWVFGASSTLVETAGTDDGPD